MTDGLLMLLIYAIQTERLYDLGNIIKPIGIMLGFVSLIWAFNACFIFSPSYTYLTHGWSFMNLETGVNVFIMVFAIFYIRAYIRCENPVM